MKNSLKEISNKIEQFCNENANVSQYVCDDFSNFISSNFRYPLMFCTPSRFRVQAGQVQIVISVGVFNLVYDKNDLIKLISDILDTITQLYTYLDDNSQNDTYYVTQQNPAEGTPFLIGGTDNVCGIQMDFVFNVQFSSDQGMIMEK
jgi:hypothetical protein